MRYTKKIQKALNFAIKVHQGQTRKGKNIPYITHPLSVALILATAGAEEDVVVAGILHDTIEDSATGELVTKELIAQEFGGNVAEIVDDVTEQDTTLPWHVRKQRALDHIPHMRYGAVLVKSADTLHNMREQIEDYVQKGEAMFAAFKAPKNALLERNIRLVGALKLASENNPHAEDLERALSELVDLWSKTADEMV